MPYPLNQELAEQYLQLRKDFLSGNTVGIRKIRDKIANAEVEIKELYENDKNLNKLKIKGVGVQAKDFLELILEKGFEEALRIIHEKRDKRLEDKLEADKFKFRSPKVQWTPGNKTSKEIVF